jgi:hypothetical protein
LADLPLRRRFCCICRSWISDSSCPREYMRTAC